jgi:hypothetical protein
MPPAFAKAIMVIGVVFVVLYVLSAFGLWHAGLPAHLEKRW